MKIIIGGAGDVGCYLAKRLSQEAHDITIIDVDNSKLMRLENQLDILIINGDSSSFTSLEEADVENAEIFIAVTDRQNTNLMASLIAKKLGAKKVIARVNNPEYFARKNAMLLHRSGVDVIISPEEQAANEAINLIEASILTETHTFGNRALHLFAVVLSEDAPIIGKTVDEVIEHYNAAQQFLPICLIRAHDNPAADDDYIIPDADCIFHAQDRVYFIAQESARNNIYHLSGKIQAYLSDVIILGGGRIGSKAAALLQSAKHRVKLIEQDKERAETLAGELPNTLVLEGDGRDADLLINEGVGEADAFIAVTGRSETNMVACLLAKSKGVKKNIALVDNTDYIRLSQAIGIDSFINKKLLTANAILKYVRKGKVLDIINLYDLDASMMEFRVNDNSKVINQPIGALNLPKDVKIAGVIRNGKGYVADDALILESFDRMVIFARTESISKVESIF